MGVYPPLNAGMTRLGEQGGGEPDLCLHTGSASRSSPSTLSLRTKPDGRGGGTAKAAIRPAAILGIAFPTPLPRLPGQRNIRSDSQPISIGEHRLLDGRHRRCLGGKHHDAHRDETRSYPIEPCACEFALQFRK